MIQTEEFVNVLKSLQILDSSPMKTILDEWTIFLVNTIYIWN